MLSIRLRTLGFAALLSAVAAQPALASFLDNDIRCKSFGCVVIHDGQNYEIYDNFDILGNICCVSVGTRLIPRSMSSIAPNMTGTLDSASEPNTQQSMQLAITENGKKITQSVFDDDDGFLDAGDTLLAFELTPNTDLILDKGGRSYSHSFFITSYNIKFSMQAFAQLSEASGDLTNSISLEDIKLKAKLSKKGNDDGFKYGKKAENKKIKIEKKINDLGDLSGTPVELIKFENKKGIRKKKGDIDEQSLRLDFIYTMPDYDMSMGIGTVNVDVIFDFYKEQ